MSTIKNIMFLRTKDSQYQNMSKTFVCIFIRSEQICSKYAMKTVFQQGVLAKHHFHLLKKYERFQD